MSYTSVKKILEEHDEAEIEEYKELVPMFERMKELSLIHILYYRKMEKL